MQVRQIHREKEREKKRRTERERERDEMRWDEMRWDERKIETLFISRVHPFKTYGRPLQLRHLQSLPYAPDVRLAHHPPLFVVCWQDVEPVTYKGNVLCIFFAQLGLVPALNCWYWSKKQASMTVMLGQICTVAKPLMATCVCLGNVPCTWATGNIVFALRRPSDDTWSFIAARNRLTGTLPTSNNLKAMIASYNLFEGGLPNTFASCLKALDVSGMAGRSRGLNGQLPPALPSASWKRCDY